MLISGPPAFPVYGVVLLTRESDGSSELHAEKCACSIDTTTRYKRVSISVRSRQDAAEWHSEFGGEGALAFRLCTFAVPALAETAAEKEWKKRGENLATGAASELEKCADRAHRAALRLLADEMKHLAEVSNHGARALDEPGVMFAAPTWADIRRKVVALKVANLWSSVRKSAETDGVGWVAAAQKCEAMARSTLLLGRPLAPSSETDHPAMGEIDREALRQLRTQVLNALGPLHTYRDKGEHAWLLRKNL